MHTPKFPDKDSLFELGGKLIALVPTGKRIRAYSNGIKVVDSRDAMLLITPGRPVEYCFPEDILKHGLLTISGRGSDTLGKYTVQDLSEGGIILKGIARTYVESAESGGRLNSLAILDRNLIEKWMEEDEVIIGRPRDPYTRIDILLSNTRVEYYVKGEKIVDAKNTLKLFETGLPVRDYIHPRDINMSFIFPSETETFCPYKGKAKYWDIKVGDKTFHDAAWSYPDPFDETLRIKGCFSFYENVLERIVTGEKYE